MNHEIKLTTLGDGLTEAVLAHWLKREGERVEKGEPLFEIELDKVTTEHSADFSGTLTQILVPVGEIVTVGKPLAIIEATTATQPKPKQKPHITPVVARMLAEHNLNVAQITGTGRNGRISRNDVRAYLEAQQSQAVEPPPTAPPLPAPLPVTTGQGVQIHLVQDERLDAPTTGIGEHLAALRAPTEAALRALARQYAAQLTEHRLAVVAGSSAELRDKLLAYANGEQPHGSYQQRAESAQVAFLFTGFGSQYVGMGQQLYATQPVFRQHVDQCADILKSHLDRPLLSVLYPKTGDPSPIQETRYAQPALFAIGYALAKLWLSWGVEPTVMLGHSLGEYIAACVAGVFGVEDALKLLVNAADLMARLPDQGVMVAAFGSADLIQPILDQHGGRVSLAAINSPQRVIMAGSLRDVQQIVATLNAQNIQTVRLNITVASHSPLVDPLLDPFRTVAQTIPYAPPQRPYISNVSGRLAGNEVAHADYWVQHLRQPVLFQSGVEAAYQMGCRHFLEVGSKRELVGLAQQCVPDDTTWLASLRQGGDWSEMSRALAQLYAAGVSINWQAVDANAQSHRLTPSFETPQVDTPPALETIEPTVQADAPAPSTLIAQLQSATPKSRERLTRRFLHTTLTELGLQPQGNQQGFFEMGIDSVMAVELAGRLSAEFAQTFPATLIFNYGTINDLAAHLTSDAFFTHHAPRTTHQPDLSNDDDLLALIEQEFAASL